MPRADVVRGLRHGAAVLGEHLPRVGAQLDEVVGQRHKRGHRQCRGEEGHVAELRIGFGRGFGRGLAAHSSSSSFVLASASCGDPTGCRLSAAGVTWTWLGVGVGVGRGVGFRLGVGLGLFRLSAVGVRMTSPVVVERLTSPVVVERRG